jgi:1-acyl-sn-glycerol-3-phosphate acyltransferase
MTTTKDLTINDNPDKCQFCPTTIRRFRSSFFTKFFKSLYIISTISKCLMRFLIWIISNTVYSIRQINIDNIPAQGPALLVSNHVSYVDGLIICGACRRSVRFVVYAPIYNTPILNFIFRIGKAIPIAEQRMNGTAYRNAFQQIKDALNAGELVCIFPEGHLTPDGEMHEFRRGVEKILKDTPVPVIPTALRGLWGSFFSKKNNRAMRRLPRGFRSKIDYVVGKPLDPGSVTAERLEKKVKALRGNRL